MRDVPDVQGGGGPAAASDATVEPVLGAVGTAGVRAASRGVAGSLCVWVQIDMCGVGGVSGGAREAGQGDACGLAGDAGDAGRVHGDVVQDVVVKRARGPWVESQQASW